MSNMGDVLCTKATGDAGAANVMQMSDLYASLDASLNLQAFRDLFGLSVNSIQNTYLTLVSPWNNVPFTQGWCQIRDLGVQAFNLTLNMVTFAGTHGLQTPTPAPAGGAASTSSSGTSPLVTAALVVGAVGVVGIGIFLVSRRKPARRRR